MEPNNTPINGGDALPSGYTPPVPETTPQSPDEPRAPLMTTPPPPAESPAAQPGQQAYQTQPPYPAQPPYPNQNPYAGQGGYVPPAYGAQPPVYNPLPPPERPVDIVSIWTFIWPYLLCFIPVAGGIAWIVVMCVWAFGDAAGPNRRNYARANLIMAAVGVVLAILLISVFSLSMFEVMRYVYSQLS